MDLETRSATIVLKTRKRLVNFRLTDDEYQRMAALCERHGAHSVSEFARDAIFRLSNSNDEREQMVARRLVDLEGRILQLEVQVAHIAEPRRPRGAEAEAGNAPS